LTQITMGCITDLRFGRLIQRQGEKSLGLSPSQLTQDQEQVLKPCSSLPKVYNRSTPRIGLILATNTYHERNGKPP
jgi:hypothetical protein